MALTVHLDLHPWVQWCVWLVCRENLLADGIGSQSEECADHYDSRAGE
jgi:hypothetical protein